MWRRGRRLPSAQDPPPDEPEWLYSGLMDVVTASAGRMSKLLRALRHRNYRLYFFGQAVSLIGLWMTRVATGWLVYRLTGSAWMLGVVGFAQHIPTFLLSPLAGTLVDRWDRRRVLVATQGVQMILALTLAAVTLSGIVTVGQVMALVILQGFTRAFDIPARQALVVEMVEDRNDLGNAIALNSSIFNGGRLVGPAVGGALIAWLGEGACFLIDGISYIAVIASLLAMRLAARPARGKPRPVLHEMGEGFVAALGFTPIRTLLLILGIIAFMGVPHMTLMPIFADEVLGGGAGTLGWLMGASGGGALIGALYLAGRSTIRGLGIRITLAAAGFGLGLVGFAASRVFGLSLVLLAVSGACMMVVTAGANTVVQTLVEDDKRSRVMAVFVMTFMGGAPLGSLAAGRLAEWIGAPATVALGGGACLLGAAWFAVRLPEVRRLARPIYIQLGIIPEVAQGLQAGTNEVQVTR